MTCWCALWIWLWERLAFVKHSQLFHTRGSATGGCQELPSDHTMRNSNTVCIACGGGWKFRALSHQRVIDTGFALNCRSFLTHSKGSMKSFLPITGVKSCLAPAWAFAMALDDSRFNHWMVYPDMGGRECELSRAAAWRLSGVVEREAPGWEWRQGQSFLQSNAA